MMILTSDWAYASLAASIGAAVIAKYALPRWRARAEARDCIAHERFLDEARRMTRSGRCADLPETSPEHLLLEDAWQQLQASDREMLRKVSEWRDERRGKHPARHD